MLSMLSIQMSTASPAWGFTIRKAGITLLTVETNCLGDALAGLSGTLATALTNAGEG